MKNVVLILLLGVATLLGSCAGTIPQPTETHVARASRRWPDITVADLLLGRRLYISKCSGCHSLYTPETHSAQSWEKTVPEMMARAKLTTEEAIQIVRYLAVMSETGSTNDKR